MFVKLNEIKSVNNQPISSAQVNKNAKKICKKLKKLGSKIGKVVSVTPIENAYAKPNFCNSNAIKLMQSQRKKNIDRYRLRVGYVITGNEAVAHMWNIDRETGEQVDCTPFREGAVKQKTVYVDATDLLLKTYYETWDMTQMPAYMFTRTGMTCVDYYNANYLAGLAA